MRLIDADALDMYECLRSYYGDAWRDAQKAIDNAPTVDIDAITESHERIGYDKGFRDGYAQALEETDNVPDREAKDDKG